MEGKMRENETCCTNMRSGRHHTGDEDRGLGCFLDVLQNLEIKKGGSG